MPVIETLSINGVESPPFTQGFLNVIVTEPVVPPWQDAEVVIVVHLELSGATL